VALLVSLALCLAAYYWSGGTGDNADRRKGPPGAGRNVDMQPTKVELSSEELFAAASPAVASVIVTDRTFNTFSRGSGFFVSPRGLLITNYHVIDDAAFACVLMADGTVKPVIGLLAGDPEADVALLAVRGENLPFLGFSRDGEPKPGVRVYALGSPQGLRNTLSEGIVSGLRHWRGQDRIQVTTAVSRGSSGGPLLNSKAEVVGVICAISRRGQLLNFAVPAGEATDLLQAPNQVCKPLPKSGFERMEDGENITQALAALTQKEFKRAVELLGEGRKPLLSKDELALARGEIYLIGGDYESALAQFKSVADALPQSPQAYAGMGKLHALKGDWPQASKEYRKAIDLGDKSPGTYLAAAKALAKARKYADAVRTLRMVIDQDNYGYYAVRARELLKTIPEKYK